MWKTLFALFRPGGLDKDFTNAYIAGTTRQSMAPTGVDQTMEKRIVYIKREPETLQEITQRLMEKARMRALKLEKRELSRLNRKMGRGK